MQLDGRLTKIVIRKLDTKQNAYTQACLYILSFQFRNFKIVYRRYAGLYFCICVDVQDNNLYYLEAIHNFVEVSQASLSKFKLQNNLCCNFLT